jgi:hypothetical protein
MSRSVLHQWYVLVSSGKSNTMCSSQCVVFQESTVRRFCIPLVQSLFNVSRQILKSLRKPKTKDGDESLLLPQPNRAVHFASEIRRYHPSWNCFCHFSQTLCHCCTWRKCVSLRSKLRVYMLLYYLYYLSTGISHIRYTFLTEIWI